MTFYGPATLQQAAVATGNGTPISTAQLGTVAMQAVLAGTATITWEGTIDKANWVGLLGLQVGTGALATTATASGIYLLRTDGLLQVRARISAWSSGAVTVTATGTDEPLNLGQVSLISDTAYTGQIGATTDAAATAGGTGSLSAKLRALSRDLIANIVLAAGTAHIGNVGGDTLQANASFIRPADTTAYAAGDAVNNSTSAPAVLTLAGCARANGGTGYITAVQLQKSTVTTTNAAFRVYFWTVSNPTLSNDNAAYTFMWADRANFVGYADLVLRTEGAGSDSAYALDDGRRIPFTCAVADTALYATLAAEAAYAPGNAEQFRLLITAERN